MRKSIRPLNSVCISIHAPVDPCLVPCLNPPDTEHDAGPSPMRYVVLLTEVAQEKTLPFAPLVPSAARCAGCRSSGDVPYRVDGRFLGPIVSTGSPRQHAGSFTRKYELVNSPTPSLTS